MEIYEKLEVLRNEAGINKKQMAETLGISPRQYSQWARADAPKRYIKIARERLFGQKAQLDRIEKKLDLILEILK
ncbi:MAG: helix-turn-helix domain-containing protein [Victivallaceae bacterium]|nr:helix-turn-helix domain-containing protein [Victivallaceae bacterium]